MRDIKVVIACHDALGEPVFAFVVVRGDLMQIEDGSHYHAAGEWALENGFEKPFVFFDEDDCLSFSWLLDHFVWESASVVEIGEKNT